MIQSLAIKYFNEINMEDDVKQVKNIHNKYAYITNIMGCFR